MFGNTWSYMGIHWCTWAYTRIFYQIKIQLKYYNLVYIKSVYGLVKLLHWSRNYELFGRFFDADSENNFSLLLNLSKDFSPLRKCGRLFQIFAPVNAKLFLK